MRVLFRKSICVILHIHTLKETFTKNVSCHYLFILISFQITDFILLNVNNRWRYFPKKMSVFFAHTIKVNEVQCCFGPHWLSLFRQKRSSKISSFVFCKEKVIWNNKGLVNYKVFILGWIILLIQYIRGCSLRKSCLPRLHYWDMIIVFINILNVFNHSIMFIISIS